jgi:hypothetical protein
MRVHQASVLEKFSKSGPLSAVIVLNTCAKRSPILLMELTHRLANTGAVTAKKLNENIVIRATFYHGEKSGFFTMVERSTVSASQ